MRRYGIESLLPIAAEYDDVVPRDVDTLLALPGIGAYTAVHATLKGIPFEIALLLAKILEKQAMNRPASAAVLADQLEALASQLDSASKRVTH